MTVTQAIVTTRRPAPVGPFARLLRKPAAVVSAAVLLVVIGACFAAPLIAPADPNLNDLLAGLQGPSAEHLLGTDALGRDLLSRLLHGGIPSLQQAGVVLLVSLGLGVPLGIAAGFLGGWWDRVITALADIGLAVPILIMTVVILTVFDDQFLVAMVLLGVLMCPPVIRNVRGAVIGVRRENFVDAARVAGLSPWQIMGSHVLPRIVGPMLVQATLVAGLAIGFTVGLSFLGFGPQPPAPTWGGMILEASQVMARSTWPITVTGVTLVLTVLALMVLGDAIREAVVDPWAKVTAVRVAAQAPRAMQEDAASATDSDALLSVRDLRIAYRSGDRDVNVVDSVSFDILPGETVGLVGESGCGKSTVARAIGRILPGSGQVVGGAVSFEGEDVLTFAGETLRSYRGGRVAYVFQDAMSTLEPTMRVGDVIAQAVRLHAPLSRAAARDKALELLASVRIPDPAAIARRYPHELSGGLAQRVAIARALAGDPDLLIADEPTTALDASIRLGILELLHDLTRSRGMALLIVSHDWDVVRHLCDRALVMYAGQIVESATVSTVIDASAHPYTRALLACRPTAASDRARPLPSIPGQVAPAGSWGEGCRFADRCPLAQDACVAKPVALRPVTAAHDSRCLFAESVLATQGTPEKELVP